MHLGLLKKGRGQPRRRLPEEPAAQPRALALEWEALSCSSASPAKQGRPVSIAGPATGKLFRSGDPTQFTHPPGPSGQVPKPNASAFTRSSGTAGPGDGAQSCSHTSSVNQHPGGCDPGGRLPLPARPHGPTGAAAARAEAPCTRRLHVDRPRTDAGVGQPGLGPALPLVVKIKTQKNCTRRSKKEKEKTAAV